ncbi:MAG: GNAT family N-acetyltransferase [Methylobacteriaceae bacterium]|nr:GNAT family N-acetyltransferase [Methylobacteriaceae bacterium]
MPAFSIAPAGAGDIATIAALFRAYAAGLGVDLCFQGFDEELATLPGKYAAERGGALLIAHNVQGAAVGCGALRALEPGVCEMKRLYVAPAGRGLGLGRALAEAICAEGRRLGYREIRLDTLPTMTEAHALYASMGFVETAPYYDNPVAGVLWLARKL